MLEKSQAENTRLKVELKALESVLESAKFQLASTAVKVISLVEKVLTSWTYTLYTGNR